jgi:hypothetical protein
MNQPPISHDSMDNADLRRARELLPWYAQGQLAGDDHLFMSHWLENTMAHHPELAADIRAELAWLRSTQTTLQADMQATSARQPQEAGLAALMQRIAEESSSAIEKRAKKPINTPANPHFSSKSALPIPTSAPWIERMQSWLSDALGMRSPALAFGIAALVMLQAGVISALLLSEPAQQAPLSGAPNSPASAAADQALLTVAFAPQATELAIRQALAAVGGQIVSGPSALGLYTVAIPPSSEDSAISQLRSAKGVVDSVQR